MLTCLMSSDRLWLTNYSFEQHPRVSNKEIANRPVVNIWDNIAVKSNLKPLCLLSPPLYIPLIGVRTQKPFMPSLFLLFNSPPRRNVAERQIARGFM